MTATQTPCTPEADRFLRSVAVPDPPTSQQGRQCYWDDTVQEAVGELRRRLASSREAVVTLALLTIVKMETTRMRHGRPVSGTQVSNVNEDWDDLPKLAPLPSMTPGKQPESSLTLQSRAEPPSPDASHDPPPVTDPPLPHGPILENQATSVVGDPAQLTQTTTNTAPPPPAPVCTEPKRTFSDRDDDWTRDPARSATPTDWQPTPTRAEADAAYDAVVERQREGYIETSGCYPEDDYPNNPDYFRFKAEPRPHPAFLRFLEWKYGITQPHPQPPAGSG